MKLNKLEIAGKTKWLKNEDFENFFKIYVDDSNNYFFNLNETVFFNGNYDNLPTITLNHAMFWPLISYKLYGTTRCAWILMKVNNVDQDHIFDMCRAGQVIRFINKEDLIQIYKTINNKDSDR